MKYTLESNIGEMLDDPKAREALYRAFPGERERGFLGSVRHLSFAFIRDFAPGKLRDEELAAVERELNALGDGE